ncbi:uncharacterized protein NPIL_594031 [Nephila pilipes]|uniref:Transcription factor Adf-1 n=1 Tax=Nephila pilipes TaxID=299642 RepID=A0A8X6TX01_NEPPI|nr:uncharacterized protein NPIL_594031 [Nephila pilipes]
MFWTGVEDEILINFVKNHKALYNVKHKDYRKFQLKQHLWNNIGTTLKKSGTDCLKRWNYVRDYYIKRRGKPGSGSVGEAAKKRSDLLSFLDDISSSQRAIIANVVGDEISEHEIAIIEEKEGEEHATNKLFPKYEETEGMTDLHFTEGNHNKKDGANDSCARNEKRRKLSHSEERLQSQNERVQWKAAPHQNEMDEVDLYFKAMAKVVKRLPLYEQAQLRMQISTLIGNAELRALSGETGQYTSARRCSTPLNYRVSDESSNVSEILILSENDL